MRINPCRSLRSLRPRGLPASFLGLSSIPTLPRTVPRRRLLCSLVPFRGELSWGFPKIAPPPTSPAGIAAELVFRTFARRQTRRRRGGQAAQSPGLLLVSPGPPRACGLGCSPACRPRCFAQPRRTSRRLPACCSWRRSWGSARFGSPLFHPDSRRGGWVAPGGDAFPHRGFCPSKLSSSRVAATWLRAGVASNRLPNRGSASLLRLLRLLLPVCVARTTFTARLAFARLCRCPVFSAFEENRCAGPAPQGLAPPSKLYRPNRIAACRGPLLPWACWLTSSCTRKANPEGPTCPVVPERTAGEGW